MEEKKSFYQCTLNVQHNKKDYEPGEKVELTAKEAAQLLEAGAVKKVAAAKKATTPKPTGKKKPKPATPGSTTDQKTGEADKK
jgi:hypothetical protein